MSPITQGVLVLDKAPIDLLKILANAINEVQPTIEARGHELSVVLPAGSLIFEGDARWADPCQPRGGCDAHRVCGLPHQ